MSPHRPSGVIAYVGAGTAFFCGKLLRWCKLILRKVLAYSTVSQLGYMFLGLGVGAYSAGVFSPHDPCIFLKPCCSWVQAA